MMEPLDFIEMMVVFAKSYPNAVITSIEVWDRTEVCINYNYGRRDRARVTYNAEKHLFSLTEKI